MLEMCKNCDALDKCPRDWLDIGECEGAFREEDAESLKRYNDELSSESGVR